MENRKEKQYLDRGWVGTTVMWVTAVLAAIALFEFRIRSTFYNFNDRMGRIVDDRIHPDRPDVLLRSQYTGIPSIDYAIRLMVAIHLPAFAGFVEVYYVQLAYLVVSVTSITVILTVEAGRKSASKSWIRYITLWTLLYSSLGGAVGLPLWFLAFLRHCPRKDLHESSSARLPDAYAKALIPAHLLGYFWSMVTVLYPFDDPMLSKKQVFIAIWIVSPFTINLLLAIFTKLYELFAHSKNHTSLGSDASIVKSLYAISFFPCALAHLALLYTSTQAEWSLAEVFIPGPELMGGSVSQMIFYIFVLDYAIMFVVALGSAFVVLVDLQTMARSDLPPVVVFIIIAMATILVGPAAAVMGAWWWREDKLRQEGQKMHKEE